MRPPDIALTQLALWYDPTRIQTWPAFLAAIPDDVEAKSPTELGRQYATGRMTSEGHSSAFNLVRNLPGLEMRGGHLQLRGVGLLERTPEGCRVSATGRTLATLYRDGPAGNAWVTALADLLLGREPRTRALVSLLSEDGASLNFDADTWFGGRHRQARLTRPGCPPVAPFADDIEERTLATSLAERGWWCLGDWRRDELLEGSSDCRVVGLRSDSPSLHDIGLALRAAMEVLLAAGIVRAGGGQAWLDASDAARALPARGVEFGWHPAVAESLVDALVAVLPALRSATGHVVASELRAVLQERGCQDPDRAIAEAEQEGRLLVYAEDYGQARHGRGLYGDPRKQLVKLRIVGRGATA